MNTKPITKIIGNLKSDTDFIQNCNWRIENARQGLSFEFPFNLALPVKQALQTAGINYLYTHQVQSWDEVKKGKNIVVVTSTASGKSLCYNIPVLDAFVQDRDLRALYIFPTKALAQDQKQSLSNLISHTGLITESSISKEHFLISTYDGDTPQSRRAEIRLNCNFLLTNPDMVHTAILPHHTIWADFFHNLNFIIIDEIHTYRGVFGSHVANVIRRLKRIANFYGSKPIFILTSATIANPYELSKALIDEDVIVIDNDGSPHGKRNFILYNPPIINKDLGIRANPIVESVRLANEFIDQNIQFLIFTRSRKSVEHTLRAINNRTGIDTNQLRGYRSGYLANERRQIENKLRYGQIRGVVSTNALELGIDIGGIDAVIMAGYPGSIASTRQQAGRTSRHAGESLAILVASNSPLDQYLIQNPDYFFLSSPEKALINPNNLLILLHHLRCAAFELPFSNADHFGSLDTSLLNSLLQFLVDEGVLYSVGDKYYWMADKYPAQDISLRTATTDSVLLVSENEEGRKIIGQTDKNSAHWMVPPGAVYLHDWDSYLVKDLDLEKNLAILKQAELDYFTEPRKQNSIDCLNIEKETHISGGVKYFGEIIVTTRVIGYKRIQWLTSTIVGTIDLDLPATTLRTTAFWFSLNQSTINHLLDLGVWRSAPNNYGKKWYKIRDQIRKRDCYRCQVCGVLEGDQPFHVHHKIPFKLFSSSETANHPDNLITLCPRCHRSAELAVRVRSGLAGLTHLFNHLAPLFLMCDVQDIGSHIEYDCAFANHQPTILLYEQIPAGIGLSEEIFNNFSSITRSALSRAKNCTCKDGCPGCVGPAGIEGAGAKTETLAILNILTDALQGYSE